MIESFLKNVFPRQYDLCADVISIPIKRHQTPFACSDEKSCISCHANPHSEYRKDCNEEILKVNNNGANIAVVEFEKYITQFEKTSANVRDRCDLLMCDSDVEHNKILFCDLCCYEEKYVEPNEGKYPLGKRAKARQQMERSIEVLLEEPMTAVFILTFSEKVCLFAWRDYDVPDTYVAAQRRDARANMQVFGSTISNLAQQTTTHQQRMGHNFTFMQVKYPSVYNW